MYVVRHEKRPVEDPSFFVSLTEEGLSDSADAVRAKLLAANITKVYASPFRRVLQTVHPFLSESGLKANVDWALYEHPEPNPEPITALPDDFHALFPIEKTYEPFVPGPAIRRPQPRLRRRAHADSRVRPKALGDARRGRYPSSGHTSDLRALAVASAERHTDGLSERTYGHGVGAGLAGHRRAGGVITTRAWTCAGTGREKRGFGGPLRDAGGERASSARDDAADGTGS